MSTVQRYADVLQWKSFGGLGTTRERANGIIETGVVLGVKQGRGASHGHAHNGALVGSLEGLLQRTRQFLGQEGLPFLLAAQVCILLLPVGVVGELAGHRDDHVDVLIHVEVNNIGLHHPVGFAFAAVRAIKKINGGTRLGIIFRGDHKQWHIAIHGRRVRPHFLHTIRVFSNLFTPHGDWVDVTRAHRHRGLWGISC